MLDPTEKISDDDAGTHLAETFRENALRNRPRLSNPDPIWEGDQAFCAVCEEENTARAKAGFGRCLECQSHYEKRAQRRAAVV